MTISSVQALDFEKLSKDSLVVLRVSGIADKTGEIQAAVQALKDILPPDLQFLVIDKAWDFRVLPEGKMNEMGWFRKEEA